MVTHAERITKLETIQEDMVDDVKDIKEGVDHIKTEILKINGKPMENEKKIDALFNEIKDVAEDVEPTVQDYEDRVEAAKARTIGFKRIVAEVLIIIIGAAVIFLAGSIWSLL